MPGENQYFLPVNWCSNLCLPKNLNRGRGLVFSCFSGNLYTETLADYDVNVQRIYFLDEVHRSYNPKGSFLSNLVTSDREAVLIGLTGTPIISKDYKSKKILCAGCRP